MFDDPFTIAYIGISGQYCRISQFWRESLMRSFVWKNKCQFYLISWFYLVVACCLVTHSQHARWQIRHSFNVIFIIANWRARFCLDTTIFFHIFFIFAIYSYQILLNTTIFLFHRCCSYFSQVDERLPGILTVCWDSWAAGSSQANLMDFFMPNISGERNRSGFGCWPGISVEPLLWTSLIIDLSDSSRIGSPSLVWLHN